MRRVEMKKQYLIISLLSVIALVTVGFALLQSNLSINGTVATKSNSWSIYFDNIVLNQNSVSKTLPTISNRTNLSFNVELGTPGDLYEFSVDAINDGTMDAMISTITATSLTEEQSKLVDFSYTYSDGTVLQENDELKAQTSKNIKVSVKYKDSVTVDDLPNNNIQLPISINIEYVQADGNIRVTSQNAAGDTVGATAKEIVGDEKQELLANFEDAGDITDTNDVDFLLEVKSDNFKDMTQTTFDVSSIAEDGDKIVVVYFNETTQKWEYVGTLIVNDGKITTNLSIPPSEVSVVINVNGNASSSRNKLTFTSTTSQSVTITPNTNYFIESFTCTNGFNVTGTVGASTLDKATTYSIVTDNIKNNAKCNVVVNQGRWSYGFTGDAQEFVVPYEGNYKLEMYGAGGTGTDADSSKGSKAEGTIKLLKDTKLYVYVGGKENTFNGGGPGGGTPKIPAGTMHSGYSVLYSTDGSGATDIRLIKATEGSWYDTSHQSWQTDQSLLSRIITAGGAGGKSVNVGNPFTSSQNLDTYVDYSSRLYSKYRTRNQTESANTENRLGLGDSDKYSDAWNTSERWIGFHEGGDRGYAVTGGGGGGWYGGRTVKYSVAYDYNTMMSYGNNSAYDYLGIITINGNRMAGVNAEAHAGTSYINNNYQYDGKTYTFTNTKTTAIAHSGNGKADITFVG